MERNRAEITTEKQSPENNKGPLLKFVLPLVAFALACGANSPEALKVASEIIVNCLDSGEGLNLGLTIPEGELGNRVDLVVRFVHAQLANLYNLQLEIARLMAKGLDPTDAYLRINGQLAEVAGNETTITKLQLNMPELSPVDGLHTNTLKATLPDGAQMAIADISNANGCVSIHPAPGIQPNTPYVVPFANPVTP